MNRPSRLAASLRVLAAMTLAFLGALLLPAAPAVAATSGLEIVAGPARAVSTSGGVTTYAFPELTMSAPDDRPVRSITVQFTTQIASGDDVTLTAADGFELWGGGKRGNRSVNATGDGGATPAQWEAYLREHLTVQLANTGGTKGLRMIASFDRVDRTLDYNSLNGHYYEYVHVPGASSTVTTISWAQAFQRAAESEYMGMTGYLVTVTSAEEQNFIASLINSRTWIGGTCWAGFTGDPASHNGRYGSQTVRYYWVCGPERGTNFATGATGNNAAMNANAQSRGYYANFTSGQPDNASGVGVFGEGGTGSDLGEAFLHMYEDGRWNDYPNWPTHPSHYVQGYIVEYGDNPDDERDPSDTDVDVDVDVDVYVKVDINVDPSGRTLTTEAFDSVAGEAPVVRENVNGDPGITTTVDGETVPAEVVRTYQRQNDDGTWGDPTEVPPTHAGTYRVTSTATYSEQDGVSVPYEPGSDTFVIRPRTVDLGSAPIDEGSVDPDDPTVPELPEGTDPSEVSRAFLKVYDGTDRFDAGSLDISGFTVPGCTDVRLVCDAEGTFDAETVGATAVTLTGVSLEGAHASDYVVRGLKDGSVTVPGRIVPRELVVTPSSTVRWGLAGEPFRDRSGDPAVFSSDEDVYDGRFDPSADPWLRNMLASRDAVWEDGTLTSILGDRTFSAVRADGTALDPDAPEAGLYTLSVHFSNVNPASDAPAVAAFSAASGPEKVERLDDGRWDLGNYLLTINERPLLVTDEPGAEDGLDGLDGTVVEGEYRRVADPDAEPVGPGQLADIVARTYGDRIPGGARDPQVSIVGEDGVPVGEIDPTRPGSYTVLLTYEDPADPSGPVTVVRLDYAVTRPEPRLEEVDAGTFSPDPAGAPLGPDELVAQVSARVADRVPAGVEPEVSVTRDGVPVDAVDPAVPGTYTVTLTYTDGNGDVTRVTATYVVEGGPAPTVVVDETLPLDPGAGALGPSDLAALVAGRYGDRIPSGVSPEVSIERDGTPVGAVDPAVPGTYVVTLTYRSPDGAVSVVRLTFIVAAPEASGADTSTLPATGRGASGAVLPATGDPASLAPLLGTLAAGAVAATAAVSRRRR